MIDTNGKQISVYALVSLLLMILIVALLFLSFYPSASELGRSFTLVVVYMIGHYVLLFGGILLFILRMTVARKLSGSFPYVFGAIANSLIGIIALYLFFFHHYTREFLHDALWNLLIGVMMIASLLLTQKNRA